MTEGTYALRDDLFAVLRHLGIAKATFVGCSMGGGTVIDFALEHPEMVTALVLVGSGVNGLNDPSQLSPDTIKYWTELLSVVRDGNVDRAREMDAKYWLDGPTAMQPKSILLIGSARASFIARTSRSQISPASRNR